jgi:sulfur-oxidizing protein SoxY
MSAVVIQRRHILKQSQALALWLGASWLPGARAQAFEEELAFEAGSLADTLKALGGIPAVDTQISLTLPDIVENGAIVPVTVNSSLPDTREIFIVVEFNPNPLAARVTIPQGTEPYLTTRIKMAETSPVYAVVRARGGLYTVVKETKVTIGGCG